MSCYRRRALAAALVTLALVACGNNRSGPALPDTLEVVIDNMQMLGSRMGGAEGEGGGGYNSNRSAAVPAGGGGDSFGDDLDDEIPF